MGATGGNMEDKKSHKKQKEGKEKGDMLKGSAPKRKERKKDSPVVVDSAVVTLIEGEESKGTHQKEKKKKKKKDKLVDDVMEVESTIIQEIKAPENQREKKERKRKRDGGDGDGDDGPLSPQPKKKSKKVQTAEETKSKEDSSQVGNVKPVKKAKNQKLVPDNTEPTVKSKKKRKNQTGFPDPGEDDGTDLSDQARKALSYAFAQFRDPGHWKFNKARQNWLVRNFWSATAIPEKYEELITKYLSAVQGNARENLIQTCRTVLDEAVTPTKEENTTEQKGTMGGTLIDASSTPAPSQDNRKETRAQALLQALAPDTGP